MLVPKCERHPFAYRSRTGITRARTGTHPFAHGVAPCANRDGKCGACTGTTELQGCPPPPTPGVHGWCQHPCANGDFAFRRLGINIYISDRVTGTQVLLTLKPNSTMVLEYVCVSCDRQPYCTAVPGPGHVLRTVCAYKNKYCNIYSIVLSFCNQPLTRTVGTRTGYSDRAVHESRQLRAVLIPYAVRYRMFPL